MNLHDPADVREYLRRFDKDGNPPNDDQLAVIMAPAEPAVVVAGAGAGKTKMMALRVAYQVTVGNVSPDDVLGLTFTRKAAGELATRIAWMLSKIDGVCPLTRPTISTYNSFASGIAADYGLLVGIDPSSRLINDAERFQIMHDIVRTWPGQIRTQSQPKTIVADALALAARMADNQVSTDDVRRALEDYVGHVTGEGIKVTKSHAPFKYLPIIDYRFDLLDIVDAYLDYKAKARLTEFSDQVSTAAAVLKAKPDVAQQIRERHKLVLLDEYQDTSSNQAPFLATLFAGGNVVAVGDPNQAIYGWRGASAAALDDFVRHFGDNVTQYSLMTGYRNTEEILEVANAMTAPLRANHRPGQVRVEELTSAAGAGGSVAYEIDTFADESYAKIADDIATYMSEHRDDNNGKGPTMAVLCRARSSFAPMAKALDERGISYIEHGNYNAYSAPESLTVRGLLRASATPGRGEALMRVLTHMAVGPADIAGLGAVARRHGISFIEALECLKEAELSDLGRDRLSQIGSWLRILADSRHRRLDDQVSLAVRLLGLDTEVGAQSRRGGIARSALATLESLAATFADQVEGASLEAFLDLVDNIDEHEKGGTEEGALADITLAKLDAELETPNQVTIMTMHAAKGLEWDYVAIPEVRAGKFDLLTRNPRGHWVSTAAQLPSWIRADARDIPQWNWEECESGPELRESFEAWLVEDLTDHENNELRRLAYVAATRPKSRLYLSGYWFADVENARKIQEKDPDAKQPVSRLFASLTPVCADSMPSVDSESEVAVTSARWPSGLRSVSAEQIDAAAAVRAHAPVELDKLVVPEDLESVVENLRALKDQSTDDVGLEKLTAGAVVDMAEDPAAFALNALRPIPREPSRAARRGSQVHEYIAAHFGAPRSADLVDVDGIEGNVVGLDLDDEKVARLIENFSRCDFASQTPRAVEYGVDVSIAGLPLRGTIDAVFDDGDGVRIVDWKTGRTPSPVAMPARELQLQLYRLAWSRVTGMPLGDVAASFIYLGEQDEGRRRHDVAPMTADEIETRVSDLLAQATLSRQDQPATEGPSGTPGQPR